MKKSSRKKIIYSLTVFPVVVLLAGGIIIYKKLYSPIFDIDKTVYIYVNEKKDYQDLLLQLQTTAHIKNLNVFKQLAKSVKYPENMRTGRYAVQPQATAGEILSILANGIQTPVKLTFNNIRLKEDFASRISEALMLEKDSLLNRLNNPDYCRQFALDTNTILCLFIPNTYEIYWNTGTDKFIRRMKKEYDTFWTSERLVKANAIPLTPVQASILASIVEEETAVAAEYPTVAGLYINRLKRAMPLQADPTVKYAVGDFSLRRILKLHLKTASPYNTYLHGGLPPGPIRLPSVRGIDAVLNYSKHNYLYMCAKSDFSGKHEFATGIAEHNRNAGRYRAALNARKIY
jgi:UPF0755 protein